MRRLLEKFARWVLRKNPNTIEVYVVQTMYEVKPGWQSHSEMYHTTVTFMSRDPLYGLHHNTMLTLDLNNEMLELRA